jgi:hypothetical protein
MLFGDPVFPEPFYQFSRDFVKIIFIRRFRLKIKVGAVIIAYGSVSSDDAAAGIIQTGNVFVIMGSHNIQRTVYVLIVKRGLLIIAVKVPEAVKLGTGVQDAVIGKKAVHKVGVKGDLGISRGLFKKGADSQLVVKQLEKKVANIQAGAGRSRTICDFNFLIKINFNLHGNPAFFFFPVISGNLFSGISERIVRNHKQFRMFSDTCNIFGCCLRAVAETFLDKVCGVF